MPELATLEKAVGYSFRNKELLLTALRNPSIKNNAPEAAALPDNQRLEFLGDAVLGILSAELLFNRHQIEDEGMLTMRRTMLVCGQSLIEISKQIKLAQYIQLGKQAVMYNEKYLADALEAIFGAVWLDGGATAAKAVFDKLGFSEKDHGNPKMTNPKGKLQECFHKNHWDDPHYHTTAPTGPKHLPIFKTELKCPDGHSVIGEGNSKRASEINAAEKMLTLLAEGE